MIKILNENANNGKIVLKEFERKFPKNDSYAKVVYVEEKLWFVVWIIEGKDYTDEIDSWIKNHGFPRDPNFWSQGLCETFESRFL